MEAQTARHALGTGRRVLLGLAGVLALGLLLGGCSGDEDIKTIAARADCQVVPFNGRAETGDLSGWTITAAGGNGWAVCVPGYFCTSFGWDRKERTIDLVASGLSAAYLDRGPPIHVAERFFRHSGVPTGSILYNLTVDLQDAGGATLATWSTGDVTSPVLTNTAADYAAFHTFSGYHTAGANPVRKVRWADGGTETIFWTGYYGAQLHKATLAVGKCN